MAGILLALGVVLGAGAFQRFGPGLVGVDHPPTPPEAAVQGVTLVQRTSYHWAILPLGLAGLAGLTLALLPGAGGPRRRLNDR